MRGRIDRVLSRLIVRKLRRRGATGLDSAHFTGIPVITMRPGSSMHFGEGFVAVSRATDQVIGVSHPVIIRTIDRDASVQVGSNCGVSGVTIVSKNRISIGEGVLIGADALIADTDFHPARSPRRRFAPIPDRRPEDEIVIGNNVFIGARAIILKGSRIGDDAVIGAGAVLRGHVPPGSICVGNPAQVIGQIKPALEP